MQESLETIRDVIYTQNSDGTISFKDGESIELTNLSAVQLLNKKAGELELLSDFGTRLNLLKTVEEAFYELGQELLKLLPGACIMISAQEEESHFIRVKKIYGLRGNLKRVISLLGVNPTRIRIDTLSMDIKQLQLFTNGRLNTIDQGLFYLFNEQISKNLCQTTEKILGINRIETMGFSFNGHHKGGVSLLMREGTDFDNRTLIESLIKQAAISIDRLRAENGLKDSGKKYRELVEKAELAIAIDDKDGMITYFNQEFANVFGYSSEEIIGQSHQSLCHPEDLQWIERIHKKRLNGEKVPEEYEFRGIKKNGKVVWVMLKTAPVIRQGRITGTRNYLWDITERKLNEFALQEAKEKAEESDRLKSAFLQNLSHEIRTPMNGILGFSSMLDEEDLAPQEKSIFIGIINQNGEQLLRIIDDIIDISKIEAGQLKVALESFILNPVLENLRSIFSSKCQSQELIFRTIIAPNTPETIFSDPYKIKRILNILLSNAVKYTNEGHIYLRIHPDNRRPGFVCFEVEDSGVGIAAENQKAIFERFSQESTDSSIRNGGTGLGLAIAKGLTNLLKGKIGLRSEKGKGSQFYFSIPAEE